MHNDECEHAIVNSPLGPLRITAREGRILAIDLLKRAPGVRRPRPPKSARVLQEAELQLREYFEGRRREFDLPLLWEGTPFQVKVWRELQRIPYGETRAYSQVSQRIGAPQAQRAVGAACGRNPFLIVVPCHRVLSRGGLGGFSGGLSVKKRLLALEGASR